MLVRPPTCPGPNPKSAHTHKHAHVCAYAQPHSRNSTSVYTHTDVLLCTHARTCKPRMARAMLCSDVSARSFSSSASSTASPATTLSIARVTATTCAAVGWCTGAAGCAACTEGSAAHAQHRARHSHHLRSSGRMHQGCAGMHLHLWMSGAQGVLRTAEGPFSSADRASLHLPFTTRHLHHAASAIERLPPLNVQYSNLQSIKQNFMPTAPITHRSTCIHASTRINRTA